MAPLIKILFLVCLQILCGYTKQLPDTYEGRSIKIGRADPLDVKIFEASIMQMGGSYLFEYPKKQRNGDHVNYVSIDSTEDLKVKIVEGAVNSRSITLLLEPVSKNEFEAKIVLYGAFLLRELSVESYEDIEPRMLASSYIRIGKADPLDVKIYETEVHSKDGKIVFDYPSDQEFGDLVNYVTVDSDTNLRSRILRGGVSQRYLSIELKSEDHSDFKATITLTGAFILRSFLPLKLDDNNLNVYEGKSIEIGRADQYDVKIYEEKLSSEGGSITFKYPKEDEYGDLVNHVNIESDHSLRVRLVRGGVGERFIEFQLESPDQERFEAVVTLVGAFILRRI